METRPNFKGANKTKANKTGKEKTEVKGIRGSTPKKYSNHPPSCITIFIVKARFTSH